MTRIRTIRQLQAGTAPASKSHDVHQPAAQARVTPALMPFLVCTFGYQHVQRNHRFADSPAVHPLEETSMHPRFRLTFVLLLVLGLAGLTSHHGWTQEVKNDPIVERMKKDIFFLASDECEGRGVG